MMVWHSSLALNHNSLSREFYFLHVTRSKRISASERLSAVCQVNQACCKLFMSRRFTPNQPFKVSGRLKVFQFLKSVRPGNMHSYNEEFFQFDGERRLTLPSLLWHCWLGGRKSIWGMISCLECSCANDLLMPLPPHLCFSKSRMVYPSGTGLPRLPRPLNKCCCCWHWRIWF